MQVLESGDVPFRWWRLADVVSPELCRAAVANLPSSAWPGWVRYSNDIEQGKRTTREIESRHYGLAMLAHHLCRGWVTANLGNLADVVSLRSDPDLHGAGLHVTDPGGWLQCHVDYELHPRLDGWERRLNLILWLNDAWQSAWGGALRLCDPMGKAVRDFLPTFGEAVLFEGGPVAYHGAAQTSADAPPRVTMAAYYLAPARPAATRRRALFMPNRDAPGCPREMVSGAAV
jgi:Rps23 Pro-64 3,4-dihydroxylase Tpa1-like proline 4-hydroxylase